MKPNLTKTRSNWRAPSLRPPRKGRPAALAVSPFPAKPREGGRRKAPQGDGPSYAAFSQ